MDDLTIAPATADRWADLVTVFEAGMSFAAEHGAAVLEGDPVDVSAPGTRPAGAMLFHGTASMFPGAGFTAIGGTTPTRPVMRRRLRG